MVFQIILSNLQGPDNLSLYKLLQSIEREGKLLNPLYEVCVTLIPTPNKAKKQNITHAY